MQAFGKSNLSLEPKPRRPIGPVDCFLGYARVYRIKYAYLERFIIHGGYLFKVQKNADENCQPLVFIAPGTLRHFRVWKS